jgi:ABC-type hemin transport system ATPase subunit
MLVVLGRPGSGCTTFLKTIAGEMHGLNITEDSHINYQGKLGYLSLHAWDLFSVQAYRFLVCTKNTVVKLFTMLKRMFTSQSWYVM